MVQPLSIFEAFLIIQFGRITAPGAISQSGETMVEEGLIKRTPESISLRFTRWRIVSSALLSSYISPIGQKVPVSVLGDGENSRW